MQITLGGVCYAPVDHNMDNEDQWQSTLSPDEANDIDLLRKYISEIITKGDISDVTVGNFNGDPDPQRWAETIRTGDFGTERDQIEFASKKLFQKLNDLIHHSANRGVLFAVQAEVSGPGIASDTSQKIASLLKLDLNEEERLQIRDDDEHSIDTVDLEDVLPEPDELQKGLMLPILRSNQFRLPGDVKFYQKDNVSGYFHDFMECDIDKASLEQAKTVFEAINEIKKERTGESADGDDLTTLKNIGDSSDDGIARIDEITTAATQIVGGAVSAEAIATKLEVQSVDDLAIDTRELPSYVKYNIDEDIQVKFPSSSEEQIEKEEQEDHVEVTITGEDLDIDALGR